MSKQLFVSVFALVAISTPAVTHAAEESTPEKQESAPEADPPDKILIDFGDDGFFRLVLWSQIWGRVMENNPGTQVQGQPEDVTTDIGLRRIRMLALGEYKRMQLMTHIGIDNQTFNGARKPQVFVHGACAQYEAVEEALKLGMGLHYINGPSRMSSASTTSFLALDSPIFTWPVIELSDQFARQLGIFARGQVSKLDYRLSLNRAFAPSTNPQPGGGVAFRSDANTYSVSSYLAWAFAEKESGTLPYYTGTYLGNKPVINLGAGVHWQPEATGRLDSDGNLETHDVLTLASDLFVDLPVGNGAFTGYGMYGYYDFGPDYVRNVGIMNVGSGGNSFAGGGNAYPMIGTGHHVYAQAGYLLPFDLGSTRLQPYAATHAAMLEALNEPSVTAEAGLNWYLIGHRFKLTLHYRNRPVFNTGTDGSINVGERASEAILQVQAKL